jgi:uncharacterized protein
MLLALTLGVSGCAREPRTFITIATGGTGGVYYPLGGALAQIYTNRIPGVIGSAQATVASVFNVQAVEQGRADIAFTQGDIAYLAYHQGTAAGGGEGNRTARRHNSKAERPLPPPTPACAASRCST